MSGEKYIKVPFYSVKKWWLSEFYITQISDACSDLNSNVLIICCEYFRLAEEELLREAKRAAARAEISGIIGYKQCPLFKTNKTFLTNTIVNNIKSNYIKEKQSRTVRNTNPESKEYKPLQHSKKKTKNRHRKEISATNTDYSGRSMNKNQN